MSRVPVVSVVLIGVSLLASLSRGISTRIELAVKSPADRQWGGCP
jgi:hypothetical protein